MLTESTETGKAWVAGSLAELIEGATNRVPVRTDDAKSGATFERLTIDGKPHLSLIHI